MDTPRKRADNRSAIPSRLFKAVHHQPASQSKKDRCPTAIFQDPYHTPLDIHPDRTSRRIFIAKGQCHGCVVHQYDETRKNADNIQ